MRRFFFLGCFVLGAAVVRADVQSIAWGLSSEAPVYAGQTVDVILTVDCDDDREVIPAWDILRATFLPPVQPQRADILPPLKVKNAEGRELTRRRFAFAVRAQTPGKIEIPGGDRPFHFKVSQRTAFGFFENSRTGAFPVNGFSFTVLPLPEEGRPGDFSGAVGEYSLTISPSSRKAAPGAVLTLTLDLVARSGAIPTNALPEAALSPELFRAYEPKVVRREPKRVTTEMLFVPLGEASTNLTVRPFSYFDVRTGRYSHTRTPPAALVITEEAEVEEPALRVIDTSERPLGNAIPLHYDEHLERENARLAVDTALHFAPSERSAALQQIKAGAEVEFLERYEDWIRVDIAGRRGWIREAAVSDRRSLMPEE